MDHNWPKGHSMKLYTAQRPGRVAPAHKNCLADSQHATVSLPRCASLLPHSCALEVRACHMACSLALQKTDHQFLMHLVE
ncbi:hypothetical protein D3C75_715410 [compost metagenome]